MVYNLWTTLLLIGATGYMMGTVRFFGIAWVEQIHELTYNWLLLSIVGHIAGVVFDTWRSGVPLVQAMVHGRKRVPEGTAVK